MMVFCVPVIAQDVDLLLCCRWAEDEGRLSCQEILQAIVAELTAQKFLTHDLKGSRRGGYGWGEEDGEGRKARRVFG